MVAKQDVSVARLTTTEAAVLALLAIEGERSAYELVQLVENAIAHVWSPARSGLFAVLPRLAGGGLATSRRVDRSGSRKHLYRISAEGRRALEAWLGTVEPGARDTFFLKLHVGGLSTVENLLEQVAQFRADTVDRLDVLNAIKPTNTNRGHDWFHQQLLLYGIARAELELEWADAVARRLRRGPR